MITILKSEIHSAKQPQEFKTAIEAKTLKTSKTLSIMNTVNMISNEKDFYGKYKNDVMLITRIRRLSLLRFLPKLIIKFPEIEKNQKFHVQIGFFISVLLFILSMSFLSNLYECITDGVITEGLLGTIFFIGAFVGLLVMELMIYKQKFYKY